MGFVIATDLSGREAPELRRNARPLETDAVRECVPSCSEAPRAER